MRALTFGYVYEKLMSTSWISSSMQTSYDHNLGNSYISPFQIACYLFKLHDIGILKFFTSLSISRLKVNMILSPMIPSMSTSDTGVMTFRAFLWVWERALGQPNSHSESNTVYSTLCYLLLGIALHYIFLLYILFSNCKCRTCYLNIIEDNRLTLVKIQILT